MERFDAIEILLVEDNPRDAELTLRALRKSHLANNILIASDGAEAIDYLFCKGKYEQRDMSHIPKIIILDLKLPKISGLEVLKIVKEDPNLSSIPVVVVTSSEEGPDIREAYRLGVNSYIVKPVDFHQFMNAMTSLGFYWLLVNKSPR